MNGAQRWQCTGSIDRNEASVIFIESATTITIVTVLWSD
jgi:hypothetical protein